MAADTRELTPSSRTDCEPAGTMWASPDTFTPDSIVICEL